MCVCGWKGVEGAYRLCLKWFARMSSSAVGRVSVCVCVCGWREVKGFAKQR